MKSVSDIFLTEIEFNNPVVIRYKLVFFRKTSTIFLSILSASFKLLLIGGRVTEYI